jgi:Tfp pilus assembly protein PilV
MITKRVRNHWQSGATIVEVLVAIALTGIFLPVLATALVAANAGRASSIQQLQAQSLIREATDAVRSVREKGWTNVAADGTYHPTTNGTVWSLTSGSETINGFTRQVVISTPQRNNAGAIVASGGTDDPSTKHVVVTVSWNRPAAGSLSTDTYLTRWQANAVWTQTSQADFSGGTHTNTCATSTCDQLSAPTNSVQLADSAATWQLPSSLSAGNITGNVAGNCVFVATISSTRYAFVGYATGLAIYNISNPSSPTLTGTFATTAAVNGVYVSGTNAYLATAITNAQFKIVNVSTPAAPTQTGSIQVGDTAAANDVFVSGTNAYLVKNAASGAAANREFNVINVTIPATPTVSGTLTRISANITSVYVAGNFAYITTSLASGQFKIINITTPTAPTTSSTVNLGVTAEDVVVNGTTAYIATDNNASSGELRIYNVTTPTAPTSVGTFEMGGNVNGVDLDSTNANYIALATAVANKQATFVNVSTPATPTLVTNLALGGTANAVMISGSFAYYGTADTAKELTVVYTGYRPSGSFESSTFDPGANVGYNYITFTTTVPANTTLTFQVAANNTNSGWTYVGPDGTAGTTYSAGDSIPLGIVSNRYFRYKATMTTTSSQVTPRIDDVEVNYSP